MLHSFYPDINATYATTDILSGRHNDYTASLLQPKIWRSTGDLAL